MRIFLITQSDWISTSSTDKMVTNTVGYTKTRKRAEKVVAQLKKTYTSYSRSGNTWPRFEIKEVPEIGE